MFARLLAILPSFLGIAAASGKACLDDVDVALNMLQVQAHASGLDESSQTREARANVEMHDRLQPQDSHFTELEQEGARNGLDEGIAVVMPGFGDPSHAELVKKNIAWLKTQGIDFECTIYVYRTEEEFPLNDDEYRPCKLVRHAGMWMDHLRAFPLQETSKKWVLHLVDSVEADKSVNLKRMIDIMNANYLQHASPSIPEYYLYPIMSTHPNTLPGRKVSFIELHLSLMTRDYFACLQNVGSEQNGEGWGVDLLLPKLCEGGLGIIDEMLMYKRFRNSYAYDHAAGDMQTYLKDMEVKYPGLQETSKDTYYHQLLDPVNAKIFKWR